MPGSLREEIIAAMGTPDGNEPEEQGNPSEEPGESNEPADLSPGESEGTTEERGDRDPKGERTPKTPSKDEVPENIQPGQEKVAPKPVERAPVSWTPDAREEWSKVPDRVKAEVIRRDREINDALRLSTEARRFHQEMSEVIRPYESLIVSQNSTPAKAVSNMMATASLFVNGTPQQKVEAVVQLIGQYGVDIRQLDSVLTARVQGRQAAPDPMSAIMAQLDQRLKPVTEFMSSLEGQRTRGAQAVEQEASQDIDTFFADPANEFANDVSDEMADLLELSAKRGQTLSLQEAYRRATMAHPTISKIIERRSVGSEAAQRTAAASRAKQAAVSVSSSGAPSQSGSEEGEDEDLRSALNASIRNLSNRR